MWRCVCPFLSRYIRNTANVHNILNTLLADGFQVVFVRTLKSSVVSKRNLEEVMSNMQSKRALLAVLCEYILVFRA